MTQNTDSWKERFDEKFADLSHVGCDNSLPCAQVKKDIKDFISQEIATAEARGYRNGKSDAQIEETINESLT